MTPRLCLTVAATLLGGALLAGQGQRGSPRLAIVSPSAEDVLAGVMTLAVEVHTAGSPVRSVTFFVDGRRACAATTAPFRCQWDAASAHAARDVRAVAEFQDGSRIVQTVRTRGAMEAFRSGADSVAVTVRVRDRHRRFVRGLGAASFRLFEDGQPQEIVTFATEASGGDVVLALDGSGSMASALDELRTAARTFLGALPRNDMVTVAAFNSAIDVLSPRGAPAVAQVASLDRLRAAGTTALYDVLIQAVDLFPASADRRAVVMFTDGDDVSSRASVAAARVALQAGNVVLYVVAQGKAAVDRRLRDQLSALATETGGAAFFASRMSATRGHFAEIAEELSNQYVLGYVPVRPFGDGSWRAIRVEPADGSLHYDVRARQGYLAVRQVGK
jgi:VWFA-related protein